MSLKLTHFVPHRWLAGLVVSLSLLVAACGDTGHTFNGTDISGANIGEGWALVDHEGKPATQQSYPGKVGLVFFGFTQCPDVCPTALGKLNQVLTQLGDDAENVQVLMISVDPERDSPEILDAYLDAFDNDLPTRFLGLTGNLDQTRKAVESYRAYFAKSPSADGGYTVDHSASFYVFDKNGKTKLLVNSQMDNKSLVDDLKALLNQ